MNQVKKKSKVRVWLVSLAVFGVLFVFPGMGWYYLQKGLDYQLEVRADLKKYGIAPALPAESLFYGNMPDSIAGKLYVSALVDLTNEEDAEVYARNMQGFLQQFDVSASILLISYMPASIDSNATYQFLEDHDLLNADHHLVFRMPANDYTDLLSAYEQSAPDAKKGASPQMAIVDDSLYIRNYYNLKEEGQINHLIQQVAILAPRGEEPSIIFEREKEK